MFYVVAGLAVFLLIGLSVIALSMLQRSTEMSQKLQGARIEIETCWRQREVLQQEAQMLHAENATRQQEIERVQSEAQEQIEQNKLTLKHYEDEIAWMRGELKVRPTISRKVYKILTLGVSSTGKTSLTLKWANPLVNLGAIEGTKVERYERTVSTFVHNDVRTEHVFEIGDWGGERIVEAVHELVMDQIHGMLIVVDLGGKGATAVDPARIQDQLLEFQPQALQYFFGQRTLASCKTVLLFINKSDLLPGTPAEAEAQAKQLYSKLISNLRRYEAQIDIQVFVGSATSGHSTHHLFSHFIEKILPGNAYDAQLLRRMRQEEAPPNAPPKPATSSRTAPLPQASPPPLPAIWPHETPLQAQPRKT